MDDLTDFRKIIMPMIRKVMPSMIAAELVGVQPMGGFNYEFILYSKFPKIENDMIVIHTAIRPFMRDGDPEPNDHYRPWLEEHIGEQGINWNWRIHSIVDGILAIDFSKSEHASLFELTWS